MDTKHQVGDVVLVRNDLKEFFYLYPMDGYSGGFRANEEMTALGGMFVTISAVVYDPRSIRGHCDYYYSIAEDEGIWAWTDSMFEDCQRCENTIDAEPLNVLYDWI